MAAGLRAVSALTGCNLRFLPRNPDAQAKQTIDTVETKTIKRLAFANPESIMCLLLSPCMFRAASVILNEV